MYAQLNASPLKVFALTLKVEGLFAAREMFLEWMINGRIDFAEDGGYRESEGSVNWGYTYIHAFSIRRIWDREIGQGQDEASHVMARQPLYFSLISHSQNISLLTQMSESQYYTGSPSRRSKSHSRIDTSMIFNQAQLVAELEQLVMAVGLARLTFRDWKFSSFTDFHARETKLLMNIYKVISMLLWCNGMFQFWSMVP